MLQESKYFKYPQHSTDLEVIAFLLFDMMGLKNATQFAEARIAGKSGYELANWKLIIDMIKRPELPSGNFFIERTVSSNLREPVPTIEQLRRQRIQLKDLLLLNQENGSHDLLNHHYRFHKILKAVIQINSDEEDWPDSIYQIAKKKYLDWPDINFIDHEGFSYTPRIINSLKNDDEQQKVLSLTAPDENYVLEGFLNGDINIKNK
jgi:hypothetical protein